MFSQGARKDHEGHRESLDPRSERGVRYETEFLKSIGRQAARPRDNKELRAEAEYDR